MKSYNTKSKKFYKKKSYKVKSKKTKKAYINKSMVSAGLGFPKKMQMTHKYQGSVPLSSILGAFVTWNFSTNSLYDPDSTGGGHQPAYYDSMSLLYNKYTVIGSKIVVNIIPTTGAYGSAAVGLFVNDDTTVGPTSFPGAIEQSLGTHRYVAYNNTRPVSFTKKWSAKKTYGGSVLANTELQGLGGNFGTGSSPTEQQYFTIWAQSLDGATTSQFWCEVIITYIGVWKELKEIAQS